MTAWTLDTMGIYHKRSQNTMSDLDLGSKVALMCICSSLTLSFSKLSDVTSDDVVNLKEKTKNGFEFRAQD